MNQISAYNNLKIKGKMPLCVGLHGGVIAFGNALGNSIVEGMVLNVEYCFGKG